MANGWQGQVQEETLGLHTNLASAVLPLELSVILLSHHRPSKISRHWAAERQ